jgi:hypothetical protein
MNKLKRILSLCFACSFIATPCLTNADQQSDTFFKSLKPHQETKLLSKKQQQSVLENLSALMLKHYVFQQKAKEFDKYASMYQNYSLNPQELSIQLNKDLKEFTDNDGHIRLMYSPESYNNFVRKFQQKPLAISEKDKIELEKTNKKDFQEYIKKISKNNFGFSDVKILNGNIGYIKLNGFHANDGAFRAAAAAMQFVENTESVIIDVRNNGGGDGRMGHFLSTYFFGDAAQVHLLNNENRGEGMLVQEWIMPQVPGKRMADTNLYILINDRTFSAAEAFPFALQAYKRATVVGRTTGGGAHSGQTLPIGNGMLIWLPSGRVTTPVDGSNWEGTGVVPDVESDKPLLKAQELIFTERVAKAESEAEKLDAKIRAMVIKNDIQSYKPSIPELNKYLGDYKSPAKSWIRRLALDDNNELFMGIISNGKEVARVSISTISKGSFVEVHNDRIIQFIFKNTERKQPKRFTSSGSGQKIEWRRI